MSPLHYAAVGAFAFLSAAAKAGFGAMDNVETSAGSSVGGAGVLAIVFGAAIGYFIERAINKHNLDKAGARYDSSVLGGKTGAIVGAIATPVLVGLLR